MRARSSSTRPFTSRPLQGERGEQAVEQLGVVEVALDGAVDAGVLHLDRHDPAVAQHGPVHLADRRRRDRHRAPVEEQPLGVGAELVAGRPTRPGSGAIGGTSACRVASAACASGGRPSAMKPSIWPAFMMAPFMWPSSRATSSAVRMANCSSSAARRSSSSAPRPGP